MINSPIFPEFRTLMEEASPVALVAKFSVPWEIQAVEFLIFGFPY